MKLSNLADVMPSSPMRKLMPHANEAKKKSVHIYHLNIGDPDIKTPDVMIQTLTNWSQNPISYADSHGHADLLHSLSIYYNNLGYDFVDKRHLQITMGASEGLLWTFMALGNPDDEFIVFEPFYANYNSFATMAKVKLIPIATDIENGFHLPNIEIIKQAITHKTKGILICNPGNPTGTVYTKKELDDLVQIVRENKLFLISDEVYREFTYDGTKAISLLSYKEQYPEGIIIVDSLSKRYSICGARVGVLVSFNETYMQTILKFAQSRLSAGLVEQVVASKMNEVTQEYFDNVNKEYRERRNVLFDSLQEIPGVFCTKPQGAFYLIVKLPVQDAENFAKWLLTDFRDNNETIMIAPAEGFYKTPGLGTNEVRIAYVLNQKDLMRSAEILKIALSKYNHIQT
ncbi:MAG TPA: pyridoxal phosphate-dependent aminotransferase [Candidatus Nitrosocosmicus sp.]|nr:pyridoxal phosphate-dependent aminotransferase [Candidatus Nitrosocosmicus sp.]